MVYRTPRGAELECLNSCEAMVRFLCTTGQLRYGSWARLSHQYLTALSKFPIRAVSVTGGVPLNGGEWASVAPLFGTPWPDSFRCNIVCAPLDFLDRLWTIGMQNIAIVGGPCSEAAVIKAKSVFEKYDQIWVADWGTVDYYHNTIYVPPWSLNGLDWCGFGRDAGSL